MRMLVSRRASSDAKMRQYNIDQHCHTSSRKSVVLLVMFLLRTDLNVDYVSNNSLVGLLFSLPLLIVGP